MTFARGAWRLRVGHGDADNPRRTISQTVHAPNNGEGRRLARKALHKLVDDVDSGVYDRTPTSVAQLVEDWIAHREPDWPAGAATNARQRLAKHVLPTLGKVDARELRPSQIAALYGRLRRDLEPATVRRVHALLHAALEQAVQWDQIPTNPAARVKPPELPEPEHRRLPTPAEIHAALADAPPWLAMLLRLAIHTGARRGELVNLRWANVDFDNAVVRIYQTKTKRPKVVPLGPETLTRLRAWRNDVNETAMRLGAGKVPWVFPSWRTGSHVTTWAATNAWTRLRRQHGLDDVRLHDMRHLVASTLIADGVDVRTVQARLGHASPIITLGVYSHPVEAKERAAAEVMERWLDDAPSTVATAMPSPVDGATPTTSESDGTVRRVPLSTRRRP